MIILPTRSSRLNLCPDFIGTTLREALPNNLFEAPDGIEVRLRRGKILAGRVVWNTTVRLTGRFPNQQPLELLPDVLAFVASETALAPTVIEVYAQRQATVSAHQEQIRLHLSFRATRQLTTNDVGQYQHI